MAVPLEHALDSNVIYSLSVMLSLCFKFGIVPDSFKKSKLDQTVAKY